MNGRVGTWLMEQNVVLQQADGAACREGKRRRQKQMPEEQFNNYSPHSMWKGIKTTQQSLSDNNRPDALNQYFSHFDTGEGRWGGISRIQSAIHQQGTPVLKTTLLKCLNNIGPWP